MQPPQSNPFGSQPPQQPLNTPPRRRMPGWAWALIGCGCLLGLLAAFAVIAVILLPVFNKGGQEPQKAACMSNQKLLGLALMSYTQDYDGKLPDATVWMDRLRPYARNDYAFHCPTLLHNDEGVNYGYAFNSDLSGKDTRIDAKVAATPMVYDADDLSRNANMPGFTPASPPRHDGKNNVLFGDGYIELTGAAVLLTQP